MMNSLINYILESGISIAVLTLFFDWALRKEKSFHFNRFYLLASVVLSLMIPFIHFSWESVPTELILGSVLLDPVTLDTTNDLSIFTINSMFLWGYVLVVFFLCVRLIYKGALILALAKGQTSQEGYSQVILKDSSDAFSLFNIIFIGDQIPKKERDLILPHERVHVIEKHSYDMVFLEIVSIVLWINPAFYLVKRLARTNHEYLADARVVQSNNKENYIQALASHTIKQIGFSLAHQFHTSSTIKRIKMINKQNTKIMKIKQWLPAGLAAVLLIALGCDESASLNQSAEASPQQAESKYKMNDGAYEFVEVLPEPKGGTREFYTWIAQNLEYPAQARKEGIEGQVHVQFVLDKSGNFTKVKAIKGIGGGCDEAAVNLIKQAASWSPGKIDDKAVAVRMVLPITFKLN